MRASRGDAHRPTSKGSSGFGNAVTSTAPPSSRFASDAARRRCSAHPLRQPLWPRRRATVCLPASSRAVGRLLCLSTRTCDREIGAARESPLPRGGGKPISPLACGSASTGVGRALWLPLSRSAVAGGTHFRPFAAATRARVPERQPDCEAVSDLNGRMWSTASGRMAMDAPLGSSSTAKVCSRRVETLCNSSITACSGPATSTVTPPAKVMRHATIRQRYCVSRRAEAVYPR